MSEYHWEEDEIAEPGAIADGEEDQPLLPRFQNNTRKEFDYGMKNDIPEIFGMIDIEEYLDWESVAENFFD